MKYSSIMPSWLKIATWFLLASLVTFFIKKPTLFFSNTNLNDLFLALSLLFFSIAAYCGEVRVKISKTILWGFAAGIGTLILGTLVSRFAFHVFAANALREYARIIACLGILLETYVISLQDDSFIQWAIIALAAGSFLLPIIFALPTPLLAFFIEGDRFAGFLADPNYYASLQILPAILVFWLMLKTRSKDVFLSVVIFIVFSLSVGSIIWSGSRGGILGMVAGLATLVGLFLWKLPVKKTAMFTALLVAGCAISLALIPGEAQQQISSRFHLLIITKTVVVATSGSVPSSSESTATSSASPSEPATASSPVQTKQVQVFDIAAAQGRSIIWKNALGQIAENPLGYGPDYGNAANIMGGPDDPHRVAHNTFLQIILTGGFILLGLGAVGGYAFIKKVVTTDIPFGRLHVLAASLAGVMAAGLFLDSLWSRWVWVILGLMLAILARPDREKQEVA